MDLLDDLKLLNKSEKELINAKTEEKLDEQSIMSITKKYAFMQNKQKQYEQDQERYFTMIRKNGYDKAHSHEAIEDQKKKLDAIVERTKPIQTKLEGYRGLPASLVSLKTQEKLPKKYSRMTSLSGISSSSSSRKRRLIEQNEIATTERS